MAAARAWDLGVVSVLISSGADVVAAPRRSITPFLGPCTHCVEMAVAPERVGGGSCADDDEVRAAQDADSGGHGPLLAGVISDVSSRRLSGGIMPAWPA